EVPQMDAGSRKGGRPQPGLGPSHEHDSLLEVVLDVPPLHRVDLIEAIEVEVRDVHPAPISVADGVRRARDRAGHAERAAGAADERRLPGAELAFDRSDIA